MAFVTEWNMTAGSFTLPLRSGYTYNMAVDWGDGSDPSTVTAYDDAAATHTYDTDGTYQISITGTCGAWYINNKSTIRLKITKVISWGNVSFSKYGLLSAFYGCSNLIEIPQSPITGATSVTTLESTFEGTGIVTISSDMFSLMPIAVSFLATFRYSKIKTAPQTLFDTQTNSTLFGSCFYGTPIENIGDGLFRLQSDSYVNYSGTFNECPKLKINPYLFYLEGEQTTRFAGKSANFTNLFYRTSFTGTEQGTAPDLWNCTFGSTPTKTNAFAGSGNSNVSLSNYDDIPTVWGAVHPAILSITASTSFDNKLKLVVRLSAVIGSNTLNLYVAKAATGLVAAENLQPLTSADNLYFEATFDIVEGEYYYSQANYLVSGSITESLSKNDRFFIVSQKPTTAINIVSPNYIQFTDPRIPNIHGTTFYNGYIYASARGAWNGTDNGNTILKLNPADYDDRLSTFIYLDKNTPATDIAQIDQIVQCSGFLWALSYGRLIRINPTDLDYMVFSAINTTDKGQPIGTDGQNLFITTNTNVYKVDASLLVDTFASYGYTGAAPISLPVAAILGYCPVIQRHATISAYSHSICADSKYIYLAITTCNSPFSGYDTATDTYLFHFQKIDKATMQTVGDVVIPKCTDDMVQSGEYVFLAPEYPDVTPDLYGSDWGLLAINKNTLEIKYLKALHGDFYTANESDRQAYGVFLVGNYILVELVASKKTIVIDISQIEQWGENFPVGGATEAVLSFTLDGVALAYPPNELVIDNDSNIHVTTWTTSPYFFKYAISSTGITFDKVAEVGSSLKTYDQSGATLSGFIIDEGKSPVTAVGFRYGTDPESLVNDVPVALAYDFETTLNSLAPGVYYFQAYATNTEGTFYGNTVVFSTYNTVQLNHNSAAALLAWVAENFGCSIRCVQDAPGVADGTTGTATDIDGNSYNTVVINGKRWMVQNLKTTRFRNGEAIPEVTDGATWAALVAAGRAAYDNDPKNV